MRDLTPEHLIIGPATLDTLDTALDWREFLKKISGEHLGKTGRGVLLSSVPVLMREAGIDVASLLRGQRLAAFIATEGPPALRVFQNEENSAQWAVVPGDAEVTPPYSQYFPPSRQADHDQSAIPRFHPTVWRCFVTELSPGFRRWFTLADPPTFVDRPEDEAVPAALEVDPEFVRTDNLFRSNEAVAAGIQAWAARNSIDISKLTIIPPKRDSVHGHNKASSEALTTFLRSLRPDELMRIALPADVIARLLGIGRV